MRLRLLFEDNPFQTSVVFPLIFKYLLNIAVIIWQSAKPGPPKEVIPNIILAIFGMSVVAHYSHLK